MVRPRTSTQPPRERAKLDSPHRINREIGRIYRLLSNGQMPRPEAEGRIKVLVALRGGMADPVEQSDAPGDGNPRVEAINIISIPVGWSVIGLLGGEAHLPTDIVKQLRELLPPGSIHRPPSIDGPLPPLPELPAEILGLLDGADQPPEPPEAT